MNRMNELVETPFIKNVIDRSVMYTKSGFPVHFTGSTGTGKTTMAIAVAQKLERPYVILRGNQEMSNIDLIGGATGMMKRTVEDNYIHSVYKTEIKTSPILASGQLVEAVEKGYILIYDEFNRTTPETNNIFLSVLEEKILPLYGLYGISQSEPYIPVHPQFRALFTSNPSDYAGAHTMQEALIDRMITINFESFDFDTYVQIVARKSNVSIERARILSEVVHSILSRAADIQYPSLRAGIMIATIMKNGSIPMDPKNSRFETLVYEVLSRYVNKEVKPTLKTVMKNEFQRIN